MGDLGRGRSRLQELLSRVSGGYSSSSAVPIHAQEIIPDKVAFPLKAGLVDPCELLCKERAAVAADLSKLVEHNERDAGLFPCHMITRDNERSLALRLLGSHMCVLICESEIPLDRSGKLLLGGGSQLNTQRGASG